MFSRGNQSFSKRSSSAVTPILITTGSDGHNKLAKSRPPVLDIPATFRSEHSPALAFSPVNMASSSNGPAPDNLAVAAAVPPASEAPLPSPASLTLPSTASIPSKRSFRSRFTFGSKSASLSKKDKVVLDEFANLSTANVLQIVPGADDQVSCSSSSRISSSQDTVERANSITSSAQSHQVADRSLDPNVLRPSSSTNLATADALSLPRMQSQPALTMKETSSRKRKSFDFAGLSRTGSSAVPGPSRPTFASMRGALGVRAFTPNGTAIREVVSEGEGEDEDDRETAQTPTSTHSALANEVTPTRKSGAPQRTNTTPTNASFAHQRRRSRSIDSPQRHASTDTSDVTRVVDLSAEIIDICMQPTDSTQAEVGHDSLEKGEGEDGRRSGDGDKEWNLQDMQGAMQRMKSLVAVTEGLGGTDSMGPSPISSIPSISPISPATSSLLNTPRLPIGRSPLVQSLLPLVPPRSPTRDSPPPTMPIPEVMVQSPSTINTERMEGVGETSFASLAPSIDVDVNAVERVLEARGVGNTWIKDVFDDDGDDSRLFEDPPARKEEPKAESLAADLSVSSRVSINLDSVDPNLAVLLSPNNLLSLTTTSTPARPSPKVVPRSMDHDDSALTLKWASNVNLRGKMASDRDGGNPPSSPLSTPHGSVTPNANNGGGISRTDSASHSRSRSSTPTPILTPILLSPSKPFSKLGSGLGSPKLEPPSRRISDPSASSSTATESGTRPTPSPFNPARKNLPPVPLPLSIPPIPGPLPPKQPSPETPFFSPVRRRVGSSPSTPASRRRFISATDDGEEDLPSSPERTSRRILGGRIRGATIGESSAGGVGAIRSTKRHIRRESSFETRPYAQQRERDEQLQLPYERPATSAAYQYRRFNGAASPDNREGRAADRTSQSSSLASGEPPRAMTSFSTYNTPASGSKSRASRGRGTDGSPPRAVTSFGTYSGTPTVLGNRRPNIDRGPPPISASAAGIRKRRSYSIDGGAGMRYALASGSRKDIAGSANTSPSHADPMGPLTKRAFAAAGVLPSSRPETSRRRSGEAFLPTSKSYGTNVGGGTGWREPPPARPAGGITRSTTIGDLALPLSRRERENGTTTPSYTALNLNHNTERDHPSTPSSASGTGNSRTLYAGSTASSSTGGVGTHRTGGSSPIFHESEAIATLKERHELEKDALLSALAETKRANKQLAKEKKDLEECVAELERKLEEALEMNRKMEGVRAAVLAMTGGTGGLAPPSPQPPTVEERKIKRRSYEAAARLEVTPAPTRRRVPVGDSGMRSLKAPVTKMRRPLNVEAETDDNTNYGSAQEVPDVEVRRADYTSIAGGPIPRMKKLTKRHSASEASVILPTMKASRETSMLIHELPPQQEAHYAESDAADDDMGEYEQEEEGEDQQDRMASRLRLRDANSPNAAPSFSFMDADERSLASSEGSLKLRLSDELHLAELVSMGPGSADERSMMSGMGMENQRYQDEGYDSNECF
ncbi:hypothetical protein FRB95_004820 [Tulasnella sp. JGI-2019a]|nr:hypothetical protein FRB95_004820 [Tulasnella sp. JGI-2019a]